MEIGTIDQKSVGLPYFVKYPDIGVVCIWYRSVIEEFHVGIPVIFHVVLGIGRLAGEHGHVFVQESQVGCREVEALVLG